MTTPQKIYTGRGDDGTTGLYCTTRRVSKNDPIIMCLGSIDMLMAQIGMLRSLIVFYQIPCPYPNLFIELEAITQLLHDICGEIANPAKQIFDKVNITWLEGWIDAYSAKLEPLREFIKFEAHPCMAQANICRCQCRNVETVLVGLEGVDANKLAFFNRLSSYFFQLARFIGNVLSIPDMPIMHKMTSSLP